MSDQQEQKPKKPTPQENRDLLNQWLIYDLQMKDAVFKEALSLDRARLSFNSPRGYIQ